MADDDDCTFPTNHLDLETTKWLEDYLRYFKGAIVIISHDRYFLDKIVTQIYDVALGDVKRYGNIFLNKSF
jgi:ATP-binding cassette subfamily F protein 3